MVGSDNFLLRQILLQLEGGGGGGGGGATPTQLLTLSSLVGPPLLGPAASNVVPGDWLQLFAANPARVEVFVQNLSAVNLDIGFDSPELFVLRLPPLGSAWWGADSFPPLERISVRSSIASAPLVCFQRILS